jgi:hypothetical protein
VTTVEQLQADQMSAQGTFGAVSILQEETAPADFPASVFAAQSRVTRSRHTEVAADLAPAATRMPLQQQVQTLFKKLHSMYTAMALSLGVDEPAPADIDTALIWDAVRQLSKPPRSRDFPSDLFMCDSRMPAFTDLWHHSWNIYDI